VPACKLEHRGSNKSCSCATTPVSQSTSGICSTLCYVLHAVATNDTTTINYTTYILYRMPQDFNNLAKAGTQVGIAKRESDVGSHCRSFIRDPGVRSIRPCAKLSWASYAVVGRPAQQHFMVPEGTCSNCCQPWTGRHIDSCCFPSWKLNALQLRLTMSILDSGW
jgi:hypothetical protein